MNHIKSLNRLLCRIVLRVPDLYVHITMMRFMNVAPFLTLVSSITLITMATAFNLTSEVASIAAANTKFGLDLFRACVEKNENLFISPFSISTALGMTQIGAQGVTAEEMKKVLHWSSDKEIAKGYGGYLPLLKKSGSEDGPGYVLIGTQRIYVSNVLPLKEEFNKAAAEHFGSEAQSADFKGNPNGERVTMNNWVSEHTRGKIKDLLPSGSISPLTAMVLIQATYFKGKWMHQFDPKRTTKAEFHSPHGTVMVDMMRLVRNFRYHHNAQLMCAAVELPYLSNTGDRRKYDLSMLVLLPDAKDGLDKLEATLSDQTLMQIRESMHSVEVNLQLPRFSMESSLQLKEPLSNLGMPTAFSDKADFTKIADDELYISQVFHKAVVEINEEGSEAAAATGVVRTRRSLPVFEPFVADHPFLFFIQDNRADVVLFMGHVFMPPSASPLREDL